MPPKKLRRANDGSALASSHEEPRLLEDRAVVLGQGAAQCSVPTPSFIGQQQAPCCSSIRPSTGHYSAPSLMDLPTHVIQLVCRELTYPCLPVFRSVCKLARELVDSSSEGWVFKVTEGDALQVTPLLNKLSSLHYVWFEGWTFSLEQQISFLAVLVTNAPAFKRLKQIRFTGEGAASQHLPFSCMRSLLASLPGVTQLALPPLPDADMQMPDRVRSASQALGALTRLTELNIEGWSLTDSMVSCFTGLQDLKKLSAGLVSQLSQGGFQSLAALTALTSLCMSDVHGGDAGLAPLVALQQLSFLRVELGRGYEDNGLGPLAGLPNLQTFGWWHRRIIPCSVLQLGSLRHTLQELSLCVVLDEQGLAALTECCNLQVLQVQAISVSPHYSGPCLPSVQTLVLGVLTSSAHARQGGGLLPEAEVQELPNEPPAVANAVWNLAAAGAEADVLLEDDLGLGGVAGGQNGMQDVAGDEVDSGDDAEWHVHNGHLTTVQSELVGILTNGQQQLQQLAQLNQQLLATMAAADHHMHNVPIPAQAAAQDYLLPLQSSHASQTAAGAGAVPMHPAQPAPIPPSEPAAEAAVTLAQIQAANGTAAFIQSALTAPAGPFTTPPLAHMFPAMEHLLLFGISGEGLSALRGAARLERLVYYCQIDAEPVLSAGQLKHLPPLPNLAVLQLEGIVAATSPYSLTRFLVCPAVRRLCVQDSPGLGWQHLYTFGRVLPKLDVLVLGASELRDSEMLRALEGMKGLTSLTLLKMPNITPRGLREAMDILPSLSTLLVSSCAGISKEACAALSRVLAAAGRDVKVELDDMVLSYALPTDIQS